MSVTNPQPLAALLASHPEECAAVVAVLAMTLTPSEREIIFLLGNRGVVIAVPVLCAILAPLERAGIATRDRRGFGSTVVWLVESADRYAIARMGAAAWLAARVAQP